MKHSNKVQGWWCGGGHWCASCFLLLEVGWTWIESVSNLRYGEYTLIASLKR